MTAEEPLGLSSGTLRLLDSLLEGVSVPVSSPDFEEVTTAIVVARKELRRALEIAETVKSPD